MFAPAFPGVNEVAAHVDGLLTGNFLDRFHLDPCELMDTSDIDTTYCLPDGQYFVSSTVSLVEFETILIDDPNGIEPIAQLVEHFIQLDMKYLIVDVDTSIF